MLRWLTEAGSICPHGQSLLLARIAPDLDRGLRRFTTTNSLGFDEPDFETARKWHAQIQGKPITKEIGEVSYARSSGPGGQNVNKQVQQFQLVSLCINGCRVNSKAQLRVSLEELLPLLPSALHGGVRSSRYLAEKTNSLLIQADDSRKQAANKETCYRKLDNLVLEIYNNAVPGETSPEQKEKVKNLKRAENESRLRMKKMQSSKKAARGKGRDE